MDQVQRIKTQHNIEQWKKIVMDQQASGLSGGAYCQLHAIRECRFYQKYLLSLPLYRQEQE